MTENPTNASARLGYVRQLDRDKRTFRVRTSWWGPKERGCIPLREVTYECELLGKSEDVEELVDAFRKDRPVVVVHPKDEVLEAARAVAAASPTELPEKLYELKKAFKMLTLQKGSQP